MCRHPSTQRAPSRAELRANKGAQAERIQVYLPVVLLDLEVFAGGSQLRLLLQVADQLVDLDTPQKDLSLVHADHLLLLQAPTQN